MYIYLGHHGDTFYIILRGQVGVFVPTQRNQRTSLEQLGPLRRSSTMLPLPTENPTGGSPNKESVLIQTRMSRAARRSSGLQKVGGNLNLMVNRDSSASSTSNLLQHKANAIKEEEESFSSSEEGSLNNIPDDLWALMQLERDAFMEVANIHDGGSFGELSLLTNKPRYYHYPIYIYIYIYIGQQPSSAEKRHILQW